MNSKNYSELLIFMNKVPYSKNCSLPLSTIRYLLEHTVPYPVWKFYRVPVGTVGNQKVPYGVLCKHSKDQTSKNTLSKFGIKL